MVSWYHLGEVSNAISTEHCSTIIKPNSPNNMEGEGLASQNLSLPMVATKRGRAAHGRLYVPRKIWVISSCFEEYSDTVIKFLPESETPLSQGTGQD